MITQLTQSTRLIPVTKWNEFHAWPPIGGLRHLIFNAHKNGFEKVLRRPPGSRRLLIDEQAFFSWAAGQVAIDEGGKQ